MDKQKALIFFIQEDMRHEKNNFASKLTGDDFFGRRAYCYCARAF